MPETLEAFAAMALAPLPDGHEILTRIREALRPQYLPPEFTGEELYHFLLRRGYLGSEIEFCGAFFLRGDLTLINWDIVALGNVNAVSFPVHRFAHVAAVYNASVIWAFHLHPFGGALEHSSNDVFSARLAAEHFRGMQLGYDDWVVTESGAAKLPEHLLQWPTKTIPAPAKAAGGYAQILSPAGARRLLKARQRNRLTARRLEPKPQLHQ